MATIQKINMEILDSQIPRVNLIRTNDDFYRYKRQVVQTRHSPAKQTFLLNIDKIATELDRSKDLILKYLQVKLATSSGTARNKETGCKETYVKGLFDVKTIEQALFDFAENFVVCPKCKNPETFYKNKKVLFIYCRACGGKSELSEDGAGGRILKAIVTELEKSKGKKDKRKKRKGENSEAGNNGTEGFLMKAQFVSLSDNALQALQREADLRKASAEENTNE